MQPTKRDRADFFWPIAMLVVLAMALLVGTTRFMGRQFDISERRQEEAVVANGIRARMDEAAHAVRPVAVWDEAVRRIDNAYDPAWAQRNVGLQLYDDAGISLSAILDGRGTPIFAASDGAPVPPTRYADFIAAAQPEADAVRREERRRAAARIDLRTGAAVANPVQAIGAASVGGRPYVVTASLVQPDFGTAALRGPAAPIVLAWLPVDRAFLDAFAHRYLLNGLKLRPPGGHGDPGDAEVPMTDGRGAVIGELTWIPARPGSAMLRRLIAPMLLVTAALGLAAFLIYRRTRRMAQGIIASEARAAHLAYHDALTGLPNRTLFFDRLAHALGQVRRRRQPVAIHCIDLDRFKEVNDTFGHHAGDELIQEAARRLAAKCRASDTFARLSGDEFAIVQVDASEARAAELAARMTEAMAEPFLLASGQMFVGCSVGVSIVSDGLLDPAEALRQADLALYRAKSTARGQFRFFEPEMDETIKTRRAVEADLRAALAAGSLELAYQPQVNGRGVMTAVEALLRWRHPERGDVSPAFFIPIAEECGLIIELGMFALRRAFEDSLRWPNLKVAVNVSANQLRMRDFVERVEALARSTRVDPRRFELEITEGVLLGDDLDTQETLRQLRNLGFAIALDDFGTGYSSLSYLNRYPIDKIKIDRSFVANLGSDAEAEAVVAAIVSLAHALRLSVLAEGVETHDQLRRLNAAGCMDVQGYIYGRAVVAEEIDRMTRRPARVQETVEA